MFNKQTLNKPLFLVGASAFCLAFLFVKFHHITWAYIPTGIGMIAFFVRWHIWIDSTQSDVLIIKSSGIVLFPKIRNFLEHQIKIKRDLYNMLTIVIVVSLISILMALPWYTPLLRHADIAQFCWAAHAFIGALWFLYSIFSIAVLVTAKKDSVDDFILQLKGYIRTTFFLIVAFLFASILFYVALMIRSI